MARRPKDACPQTGCLVLAALHGAGVEASSDAWTSAYEQQASAWVRDLRTSIAADPQGGRY